MKFDPPLQPAILLRRYKRFLADVMLDGKLTTVHCANTGSMTNCVVENSPCWVSTSNNAKRKYPHTLELVTSQTGHLAGINTIRANALVAEALDNKRLPELALYPKYQREAPIGVRSRADFLLYSGSLDESEDQYENSSAAAAGDINSAAKCYMEVKSVTYGVDGGLGLFPDAKSERASRHLDELMGAKARGDDAVLLFCVQHAGIDRVAPADKVDPAYGVKLREAAAGGLKILAYACDISPQAIVLAKPLMLEL